MFMVNKDHHKSNFRKFLCIVLLTINCRSLNSVFFWGGGGGGGRGRNEALHVVMSLLPHRSEIASDWFTFSFHLRHWTAGFIRDDLWLRRLKSSVRKKCENCRTNIKSIKKEYRKLFHRKFTTITATYTIIISNSVVAIYQCFISLNSFASNH